MTQKTQIDLDAVLIEAWQLIQSGVTDRKSPFHLPTVSTVTRGGGPSLRTVVLRGADPERRRLRFHTDRRSAKFEELERAPQFALHVYDPAIQTQIRLFGTGQTHHNDAEAKSAWNGSAPMSRLCYAAPEAPGQAVAAPPAAPRLEDFVDGEGFENFCAVVLQVDRLEWLHLAASGHQRALFVWDASGDCSAQWLAP